MTTQVERSHIQGQEHWTKKGDAKLFLWEKRAPQNSARTAAPSCSCTARRWPRSRPSTCRCPGAIPRRMDYFAGAGLRHLVRRHGGLRPLHQGPRHRRDDRRRRRRPRRPATDYIFKTRNHTGPLLVYGISSGALRAALFAQRHPEPREAARARRPCLDRRRQPDAGRAPQEAAGVSQDQAAGRSTAPSCARSSSATIPAPPTTT